MTLFDLQPFDLYEARFNMIATIVLLSQLGVIEHKQTPSTQARESDPTRPLPTRRTVRGGCRLVRPPRSC